MAVKTSKVKAPLGMQTLTYYPIKTEPDSAHPTYDTGVDLGAAVKGYLTVTTASASIPGDDITQLEDEIFTGGQLDSETTMSDLAVNATLYGHTYTEVGGEESPSSTGRPACTRHRPCRPARSRRPIPRRPASFLPRTTLYPSR